MIIFNCKLRGVVTSEECFQHWLTVGVTRPFWLPLSQMVVHSRVECKAANKIPMPVEAPCSKE